jgi:hypothetical protein
LESDDRASAKGAGGRSAVKIVVELVAR